MAMYREENPECLRELISEYLGCPCRYFPPAADGKEVVAAYEEAKARGEREGFTPILVALDGILWECLLLNACPSGQGEEFLPEERDAYRKQALAAPVPEGNPFELSGEPAGFTEPEDGQEMSISDGLWDYAAGTTLPLLMAEIPVKNPWEIFAFLPFGGWNECPDTPMLMAAAKYWYQKHGAVPAVITHDVLEFSLPRPVSREEAPALAMEQYAFCPDTMEQGNIDPSSMAGILSQSCCWYFWWD